MYYRETATKSGYKISAKHRGFNCAVLPYIVWTKGDRTLQYLKRFRVGQRAIKTALSVGLALALAMVLGSSLPIFAAIGAISVMSRTWVDSLKESLNQIAGTFLGYLIACVFVAVLPNPTFFLWMAIGVLCVISLCIGLKLNFAIPLASIVFADVCLYTGGDSIVYGFHRFTDTLVGLVVALAVNVVIRPYNNRQKIITMMGDIQKMFLPLLQARVLEHRYPDLTPLTEKMTSLASELRIFEKQPVSLRQHAVRVAARRQEAAYLRGCEQLLAKMCGELAALCNMDSNPAPGEKSMARLQSHGLTAPEDLKDYCRCSPVDAQVMDFHIGNLLDAYDFLNAFHHV